jgi:hypothetical protein
MTSKNARKPYYYSTKFFPLTEDLATMTFTDGFVEAHSLSSDDDEDSSCSVSHFGTKPAVEKKSHWGEKVTLGSDVDQQTETHYNTHQSVPAERKKGPSTSTSTITISREYFPAGRIDIEHAISVFPRSAWKTEDDKEALVQKIYKDRKRCKEMMKENITKQIHLKLKNAGVYYGQQKVLKVGDITEAWYEWKEPDLMSNAPKLFNVLIAQFDDPQDRKTAEKTYMKVFNWQYANDETVVDEEDGNDPSDVYAGGCVGKLYTQCHAEIRQKALGKGRLRHGMTFGIANARGNGSRPGKRKKAKWDPSFLKRDTSRNNKKSRNSKVMDEMIPNEMDAMCDAVTVNKGENTERRFDLLTKVS